MKEGNRVHTWLRQWVVIQDNTPHQSLTRCDLFQWLSQVYTIITSKGTGVHVAYYIIRYTVEPLYYGTEIKDTSLIRTLSVVPATQRSIQSLLWSKETILCGPKGVHNRGVHYTGISIPLLKTFTVISFMKMQALQVNGRSSAATCHAHGANKHGYSTPLFMSQQNLSK